MPDREFGNTDVLSLLSPQFVRDAKVSGASLAVDDRVRSASGRLWVITAIVHVDGNRKAIAKEIRK